MNKIHHKLILSIAIVVTMLSISVPVSAKETYSEEDINQMVEECCKDYDVSPYLVESIIFYESTYNPNATNRSKTCFGLMQIGKRWHKDRMDRLGVTDLYDPESNILVGVDYLQELFEKYEDPGLVLMIYHGEKNAVYKANHGIISNYAQNILERAKELEETREEAEQDGREKSTQLDLRCVKLC